MLPQGKRMEIAELYDLTKSISATAELAGVDRKTVRRIIGLRASGTSPAHSERERKTDPYLAKIEEWVDRSSAKIRADVVHDKLLAMGYRGSERTTRRVVNQLKREWISKRHRIYKPPIAEPGLWLQYDFAEGPLISKRKTTLFVAWLAWSRVRVVFPIPDKTFPSVTSALDRTFRLLGGVPTYILTDNERTVTSAHIAKVAVRNPQMLSASLYYGFTLATCVPYDPQSKGGSESAVRVSKADLVPSDANLLATFASYEDLEDACASFTTLINSRIHSVTGRVPLEMLEVERASLHEVPPDPYTAAFGLSRTVSWSAVVTFQGARYSVPYCLAGSKVWVRVQGEELVISACGKETHKTSVVAIHPHLGRGGASIKDEHYPPRPPSPSERPPRATSAAEAAFLAIGDGAARWLVEAGASGTHRISAKMSEAVDLTQTYGVFQVDEALGLAALLGRFAQDDLLSLLNATKGAVNLSDPSSTLQPGTSLWEGFGQ